MSVHQAKTLSEKTLRATARSHGLSVTSLTGLAPLLDSVKPLNEWQQAGYAGEMSYMLRSSELLSAPLKLFPAGRSIASFAVLYDRSSLPQRPPGYGRIARYAWGIDYHVVIKERLLKLIQSLEAEIGESINFRIFSDSVPLLERALAERAGLGFVGKNSLLIRPGVGSYFFLAEVLWDIEVETDALSITGGTCGSCSRCIEQCPTGAIVSERVIDSRRCISYLSIEKRSSFNAWERKALGEWLFGCDICQEVCPFNFASLKNPPALEVQEFSSAAGCGPLINLSTLLGIRSADEFGRRFKASPLLRAKRDGLLRNAACVAANTLAQDCIPVLIEAAQNDSAGLVRQHALWALAEMEMKGANISGVQKIFSHALGDPEAAVKAEAKAILENYFG